MGPISFTLNLNSKWGEIALENESSILFYFILSCAHSISFSLLSLAGHRDKLKIKSTRKIIYKKHSQALAFYPYCSVRNSPSLQGEESVLSPKLAPANLGQTELQRQAGVGAAVANSYK